MVLAKELGIDGYYDVIDIQMNSDRIVEDNCEIEDELINKTLTPKCKNVCVVLLLKVAYQGIL